MDQDKRLHRSKPLPMRLSMRSACPYITSKTEQRIAVDIDFQPSVHDSLARAGFRRVENWVYKPACPNCQACLPWRVDVRQFRPSRNMTRISSTNVDLTRSICEARPTSQHYQLFKSYVTNRHDDGQMARMGSDDFTSMINNSPIETVLVSHYDDEDRLVGSVLADFQSDGLSAVYSFFDTEQAERSLGTYMVLDLLAIAKELSLDWLYLGYFVQGSRKMAYKERFKPAEIFDAGIWKPADDVIRVS